MSFLLDTNVVSELRKREAAPQFRAWAEAVALEDAYLSVMTVRELEFGVLRKERSDPKQGAHLRRWLEKEVLEIYEQRLLDIDLAIARQEAKLQLSQTRPSADALIAATALVHGLTVVSRNVKDFAPMGVAVLDPWEEH